MSFNQIGLTSDTSSEQFHTCSKMKLFIKEDSKQGKQWSVSPDTDSSFAHRFHSGHDLLQLILGLVSDALSQGASVAVDNRLRRSISPVQDGDAANVVHSHGAEEKQSFIIYCQQQTY